MIAITRQLFFASLFGTQIATLNQPITTTATTTMSNPPVMPVQPHPKTSPLPPLKGLIQTTVVIPKGPDLQAQIDALASQVKALQTNQATMSADTGNIWSHVNTLDSYYWSHNHPFPVWVVQNGYGSWRTYYTGTQV
jgi:hypothetical protein